MNYVSTRGESPPIGFLDAVLAGLASDGGLYVPEVWPLLSQAEIVTKPKYLFNLPHGHLLLGHEISSTLNSRNSAPVIPRCSCRR